MTYLQALILGIVQGITEFLPISSSGHLVIIPYLLGWNLPEEQIFPFDVLVQFSTLFAVLIYYRNDILQISQAMWEGIRSKKPFGSIPARTGWFAILATIPAGITGILLKDLIEGAFSKPRLSAIFLLVTASMLFFSERFSKKARSLQSMDWKDSVVMGISQAIAILPGISRSGSTISGGLFRGLDRKTAGQFSFLMAIPIMAAAGLLSLIDLVQTPNLEGFFSVLAIGFVTSGVVGFFSIKWLLGYINNNSLKPFALYCAVIGLGTLLISFFPLSSVKSPQELPAEDQIIISYQPAATWMVTEMRTCQNASDESPIFIMKTASESIPSNSSVHISYGEMTPQADWTFQIGADQIHPAASSANPIESMTLQDLKKVFTGEFSDYKILGDRCESCELKQAKDGIIKIWSYASNSPLEKNIRDYLQSPPSSASYLAPTALQLSQVLKADPDSIGFLPGKMIEDDLKKIKVLDSISANTSIPILASSFEEPSPYLQQWLICVQNSIN